MEAVLTCYHSRLSGLKKTAKELRE